MPIRFALANHLDPKAVAMKPATLVPRRSVRQTVGRLERKRSHQANLPTGRGFLRLRRTFYPLDFPRVPNHA